MIKQAQTQVPKVGNIYFDLFQFSIHCTDQDNYPTISIPRDCTHFLLIHFSSPFHSWKVSE
jgi:hypothetical protein